jgi:hypothetical protein
LKEFLFHLMQDWSGGYVSTAILIVLLIDTASPIAVQPHPIGRKRYKIRNRILHSVVFPTEPRP